MKEKAEAEGVLLAERGDSDVDEIPHGELERAEKDRRHSKEVDEEKIASRAPRQRRR